MEFKDKTLQDLLDKQTLVEKQYESYKNVHTIETKEKITKIEHDTVSLISKKTYN